MLRDAYEQMISGWEKIYDPQTDEYKQFISMQDKQYKQIVDDTLSWMNRVTKLRVGRDGFMFVVSKETNRILAHPNEEYLGRQFSSIEELKDDDLEGVAGGYYHEDGCVETYSIFSSCDKVDYCFFSITYYECYDNYSS
jgi:hypothetical protein